MGNYRGPSKLMRELYTHNGLIEFGLNLPQQPVEGLSAESKLLGHAARAQRGAQVDVEEQRGVLLRLPAQWVVPIHNHQLLAQFFDSWEVQKGQKDCHTEDPGGRCPPSPPSLARSRHSPSTTLMGWRSEGRRGLMWKIFCAFQIMRSRLHGRTT